MLDDISVCAEACDGAGDQSRIVGKCGTRVGNLKRRAVGDGFEEAEKGYFVCGETWGEGRRGADLGDVDGATSEGR